MANHTIEQLISTLVVSPSDEILCGISSRLIEAQNDDLDIFISKSFQSLFILEHWAWEILSRDCRQWHDDEKHYFDLFSNLSLFNIKVILNTNDGKTKESLLLPSNLDIIDRIFTQIEKRQDENDRFLSIINIWFDVLSLLIHEHIELTLLPVIIHINERIISDFIINDQLKIYLHQLENSSPLITIKQLFYIKTCVYSLSEYLFSKPQDFLYNGEQILNYIARSYTNIILIHSQTVSSWSKELLGCITHLIAFINACLWWIGINETIVSLFVISNTNIYNYIESLIDIISYRPFHEKINNQSSNDESILIDHILGSFKYFVNFQNILNFFRLQKKLIDTFIIFNHINNDRISLITYRLQSEILSEDQIKQLNITNNITEIFFYYLHQAWKNPLRNHKKIPIEDLLTGLLILSKNDIIKNAIVNSNQLSFLIALSDEYPIIYNILWSLSFHMHIQEQLRFDQKFIDQLENKCANEQMQKVIHGIQWNLNSDQTQFRTNTNQDKFDIIISYSHKNKLLCTQLYNELIQNGYHVWSDLNEMHENVMDAMVQAIERSRIIIICMSESYQRSNYCRAEAQYAFKRQLKIIPILIQEFYQPDGWLRFLIGGLIYTDFTKYEFPKAINMLLNEIKTPRIAVIDSLVVRQQPQNITNLPISTLRSTDIRQWTQSDVQQWLTEHNLLQMAHLLSNLNGSSLIHLSKLISNNSPQENLCLFQEDSIKRTGRNVSLIEIARLQSLIEEQTKMPVKVKGSNSRVCCRLI